MSNLIVKILFIALVVFTGISSAKAVTVNFDDRSAPFFMDDMRYMPYADKRFYAFSYLLPGNPINGMGTTVPAKILSSGSSAACGFVNPPTLPNFLRNNDNPLAHTLYGIGMKFQSSAYGSTYSYVTKSIRFNYIHAGTADIVVQAFDTYGNLLKSVSARPPGAGRCANPVFEYTAPNNSNPRNWVAYVRVSSPSYFLPSVIGVGNATDVIGVDTVVFDTPCEINSCSPPPPPPSTYSLAINAPSEIETGKSATATATLRCFDYGAGCDTGWTNDYSKVGWVSSSPSLIGISGSGRTVTLNTTENCGRGTVTITATTTRSPQRSGNATIRLKDLCTIGVEGNVGAGGDIKDISIDPQSVAAGSGQVKVDGADVISLSNYSIIWDTFRDSQIKIVERLERERGQELPSAEIRNFFNLNPASGQSPSTGKGQNITNPDGGFWIGNGDLTINGVEFCGKGTIVVRGKVIANGRWIYDDGCPNSSLGIIILPERDDKANALTVIGRSKIIGSFFVDGTVTINGSNVLSDATVIRGTMVAEKIDMFKKGN